MAEQLICNQQVAGSNPIASSTLKSFTRAFKTKSWEGEVPERPKGADCKSVGEVLRRFESSPLHQSSQFF